MGRPKKLLTREIVSILEISESALKKWRDTTEWKSMGIAVRQGNKLRYDPEKFLEFLIIFQKFEYAEKIKDWIDSNAPAVKKTSPVKAEKQQHTETQEEKQDKNINVGDIDFSNMPNMDVFESRKLLSKLIFLAEKRLSEAQKDSQIAFETNNITKLTTELRRTEELCVDLDTKMKELIPFSVVEKWIGDVFTKIKTDIRTIPFSVSEQIANELEIENTGVITAILKVKIDDALRHMSKSISEYYRNEQ